MWGARLGPGAATGTETMSRVEPSYNVPPCGPLTHIQTCITQASCVIRCLRELEASCISCIDD